MAKRKRKLSLPDFRLFTVKGHKGKRKSCKRCTSAHTKAQHRFHGKGSFKKTHK